MKKICLLITVILSMPAFTAPTTQGKMFANKLVDYIIESKAYDYSELRFKRTGAIPSCRQEFYFALALFSTGKQEHAYLANDILSQYLESQVTNPDSPYFGSWYYPEMLELTEGLEWDMFNPIPVAIMLNEFDHLVTKENKILAYKSFKTAIDGLQKYWIPNHTKPESIGHTNYHLMYVADLLLMSEYCGDATGVSSAITTFQNWIDWTKRNGITEFNSPTYTGVDLQALNVIERYGKNKRVADMARKSADLLIADSLLHWKRPYTLVGANSRSYDVLTGEGKTCRYLEMTISGKLNPPLESSGILEIFYQHVMDGWVTGLSLRAEHEEFTFSSKWGPNPWQTRKTWFGKTFVLGTSGQRYGSQDRNLVIDRRDGIWTKSFVPVIAINEEPYRLPEIGGGSGLNHLRNPAFTVQDGNKALQLNDIVYEEPEFAMNRLSLAFLFPDSKIISPDREPKPNSPFAFVTGDDLVMVRPFVSSDDATTSIYKKEGLAIVEIRLVHDLREDLGRRFFAGFTVEVAQDAYEPQETFREWLKKPMKFEVDPKTKMVKASFDGLKIEYDPKTKKPINVPPDSSGIFVTPWTCMDDDGLWTSDWGVVGY
jgi:hypothetical protein